MFKRLMLAFLLALFSTTFSFAQETSVSGKVTDNTGKGIPGATIAVKGSRVATVTDELGNFTINAKKGATLVVTSAGYSGREFTVSGTGLTFILTAEAKALEEVVVTALGVKKERKVLTYSETEVNGADLTGPRTVDVANSLEGKVAGLNIAPSATGPQGSTRIVIRGSGSLSGENQPLIVVDGVPMDNTNLNNSMNGGTNGSSSVGMWGGSDLGDGISTLNPDDIESVSILKGGTAAALYGSRASNGAILVTTKSGNKNSTGIGLEVNSNLMFDKLLYPTFKDYQYEYGIGDIVNGSLEGQKPTTGTANSQTNSYGAPLDGTLVPQFDGVARPYVAQKNNLKDFYHTGTTWTNSVAMSGSSDKFLYRFSLSDLNCHGISPNNTLRRDNFGINLIGNLSKWFTFQLNAKYTTDKSHNPPRVSDSPGNADYSMYTLPTSLSVKTLKEKETTPAGDEYIWSNNQYVNNPYFAVNKYEHDLKRDRILTSFVPKFNITKWLYVKGIFGFDRFNFTNTDITPTGTGYSLGGNYNRNLEDFSESNVGVIGGLDTKLSDKWGLSAFVGNNLMKRSILSNNANGGPFNIPYFYDIGNIKPSNVSTTDGDYETRINSVYADADLSYSNFLFLNLTGRNDWFSTLTPPPSFTGTVKNHIFYPSVGISFILSDAFKLPSFVDYAKLRASWAQVGGATTPYQLALSYSLTGAVGSAPLAQIGSNSIPNEHLQPLTDQSDELGLEGQFLRSRLIVDIAVYQRKTTKDIISATVTPATGYTSATLNLGKINNNGVELLLSYRWISQKDFSWTSALNVGYNKSKVVNLNGTLPQITVDNARTQTAYIAQKVGKQYSEVQVVAFARNANGQILNDTATGLPVQASGLKDMGTGVSPWTTGLNNTFTYKRFALSFLIDAKFGGVIFLGTQALAYRYGLAKGTLPGRTTGIAGPGVENTNGIHSDVPNTKILPAETYYVNLYNYGEPFVYSSDFIKLRALSLDYNFTGKLFHNNVFKGAVLSIVARNLWTIMKHTPNIDPESTYNNGNAQGLEFASTPLTKSYGLNLNLKF